MCVSVTRLRRSCDWEKPFVVAKGEAGFAAFPRLFVSKSKECLFAGVFTRKIFFSLHNEISLSVVYSPTSIVVVPAAGVVVLQNLRGRPSLQQVVHLVLLPPGQRLAKDLSRFVHVEVSSSQEPQYVFILRDLIRERTDHLPKKIAVYVLGLETEKWDKRLNKSTVMTSQYLPLVRLLQPFPESDEAALLQGSQVT